MFHIGRAGRGLSLPTQESIRMLCCGVLMTKPCTHSTSRPLTGSTNVGCNQERFSSSSSLVSVGKNSKTSKNGPCCSTMGKIVMSLSAIAVVIGGFLRPDEDAADVSARREAIGIPDVDGTIT